MRNKFVLRQLRKNTEKLSCMTLSLKNLRFAVYKKYGHANCIDICSIFCFFQETKDWSKRIGIYKWCHCPTQKWKTRNHNLKEQNLGVELNNAFYEELKPISDVEKECSSRWQVTMKLCNMILMKFASWKVITRNPWI